MLLTTILSLLPIAFAIPAPNSLKQRSPCNTPIDPVWTLTDLYYHSSIVFSTPAHQIPNGYIGFNLSNSATDYVTSCSGYSTQLSQFFYGTQWFTCATPEDANGNPKEGAVGTWFRYNRPTGQVDVNQTWVCNGDTEIRFSASGNGTKELDCTTTKYQNQNWTMGQIYSTENVECKKETLTFKPSSITAVAKRGE